MLTSGEIRDVGEMVVDIATQKKGEIVDLVHISPVEPTDITVFIKVLWEGETEEQVYNLPSSEIELVVKEQTQ